MYEIVIGGWDNTKSVIRKAKWAEPVVEVDTPGILDGTTFKVFWVSWTGGVIEVGTGTRVGQGGIMSYDDPEHHAINSLSLTTGFDYEGVWSVGRLSGKLFLVLFW